MIRLLLALIGVLLQQVLLGQAASIVIDGCFDDWGPSLTSFTDSPGSVSGVDILSLQVSNDDEHLFLKLVVDTELDLIDGEVPHDLYIQIDTDNDPTTGFSLQGGTFGSELGIHLMARSAFYNVQPFSTVDLHDIGYKQGPTVTSDTFEIALDRSAVPDGLNPLFPSSTIRILVREAGGDEMPDTGSSFSYTFDNTSIPISPITLDAPLSSDLRTVVLNTENDGLLDAARLASFERMLKSLDPEVIGFSECYSTTASDVKSLLDAWIPLGTVDGWFVLKDDFELITASRWPMIDSWPMVTRQFPVLLDLPISMGTDLLFTNAHLSCCSNNSGRQDQVDEYAAFILDAKTPGGLVDIPFGTPMIYGGDLNLVGWEQQLNTLLTGDIQDVATWGVGGYLDWDNTDLTDSKARLTHEALTYTWENLGSSYPPGRLDFLIYSDAVLNLDKAFVLNTQSLPASDLAFYGLASSDSPNASDHMPVVCDFSMLEPYVEVAVKAFLQGPYDGVSMDDDLRLASVIPLLEPYSAAGFDHVGGGGESTTSAALGVAGPDAIVDWVLVSLRDKADGSVVLGTRSALIQRDGDIVDIDGSSPVRFDLPPDDYYVSVQHRNHLGTMTNGVITLTSTPAAIDFTNGSSAVFGTEPLVDVAGTWCMCAGNVVADDQISYLGSANDRDAVLMAIGGSVPTNTVSNSYSQADLNMDGVIKYTGANNDRDIILLNIGGAVPTATRSEQLP